MQNGSPHIAREQTLALNDTNSNVSTHCIRHDIRRLLEHDWIIASEFVERSIDLMYLRIEFQPAHKQSPLFSAVFAGNEKIVENLLAAGADRNIKDPKVCADPQISKRTNERRSSILISAWQHSIAWSGLAWIQSMREGVVHITKSWSDREGGCEEVKTNKMCNREHAERAAQYLVECSECGRFQCTAFGSAKWTQSELPRDFASRCGSRCPE